MDDVINPRAVAGDNRPPPSSPFEAAERDVTDLYDEARLWLDGKPVESQDQADGLSNLLNMIRAARARAEEARRAEKKPHDEAAAAVQKRYMPILQHAERAAAVCKAALTPWQVKQEAEQKAAAELARSAAEHTARLAAEAFQASESTNLAERARAEQLATEAKAAERVAIKAEKAKAHAGNIGRAVGLRTTYSGAIIDETAVAAFYWRTDRVGCREFFQSLVDQDVRAGVRAIPGVRVDTLKQAV